MPITPIDCSKTIIYKIQPNEKPELLYIGSTTNFKIRKTQHKLICNKGTSKGYNFLVYKMIRNNGGWDNFTMIQIKEFPCNNIRESEAEEYRLMHELKASLNVHKYTGDCRKEYYKDNKERIREYLDNNKQYIQTCKGIKYDCVCGGKYTHSHIARHLKSVAHLKYISENPDVIPSI